MSQDFEVIEADPKDLDGISRLLRQRSMQPDDGLWKQYCATMSESESGIGLNSAFRRETSFVVIDKIGIIRGFGVTRQRRHPNYPRLLDVPVLAVEKGPNENEIARALFDHLLHIAERRQFDALRFGRGAPSCWKERTAADSELGITGTIMPLDINRHRDSGSPQPSSNSSPTRQRFGDRSYDQSKSYSTDAGCFRRSRSRFSA